MGFWDSAVWISHKNGATRAIAAPQHTPELVSGERFVRCVPNPHSVCTENPGLYTGGVRVTENLIVTANLALLALVLVPLAAVFVSGMCAMLRTRRRRVRWETIAGIGEIPVLRE